MRITIVAGARPNFIKIAPIVKAIERRAADGASITYRLIHTGQHYDPKLSATFFDELGIPEPDLNLEVGSGTQSSQTGAIMIGFEKELSSHCADLVLVVGDVNSTLACSIVAKKLGVSLAHVEAGIRSGDMSMPEEINRIVTDSISDYLFTTSHNAGSELIRTGKSPKQIFFVGNVMIDTLLGNLGRLKKPSFWNKLGLQEQGYYLMTLHRPSNVDAMDSLGSLLEVISMNASGIPVVFPVHPRTKQVLESMKVDFDNFHFVEPQGYLSFVFLIKNAAAVLTDSGGITEEASVLNVPCLTFRESTERPETVALGTNVLVGKDHEQLKNAFDILQNGQWKQAKPIPMWDGRTAERIVSELLSMPFE